MIITHHRLASGAQGRKAQKIRDDTKLKELVKDLEEYDRCLILHSKNTGSWLNLWVNMVTVTALAATELCDFMCACYKVIPPI